MFTRYSSMREGSSGSSITNVKLIFPSFILLFSTLLLFKGQFFFPEWFYFIFSTASVYLQNKLYYLFTCLYLYEGMTCFKLGIIIIIHFVVLAHIAGRDSQLVLTKYFLNSTSIKSVPLNECFRSTFCCIFCSFQMYFIFLSCLH